jgi:putative iron-regulated protein
VQAETWYAGCLKSAQELQKAVTAFLAAPDEAGLAACRQAWLTARQEYRPTEALRFYAGPIDDDDGLEHLLNSWPVDESYLERVPGSTTDGLVENTQDYPELTIQLLERLNEREGEKNITCGWHAIEFLLWGQDLSKNGPGARPATDFAKGNRRGQLLDLMVRKLITDLTYLHDDWVPGKLGNYRAMWEEGVDTSFGNALSGLTLLCEFELAGSRLQVPYDTQEQEEEHSCFSDSTHLDFTGNLAGVASLWKILQQAIPAENSAEAAAISTMLQQATDAAKAIPAPFDQAILGADDTPGRVALKTLIVAVEDLGQALRKLGEGLEVAIPDSLEVVE